jgi:hypothetical protein
MKCIGNATPMTASLTASGNISIMLRTYKENAAEMHIQHGNGINRAIIYLDASENLQVRAATLYVDTGANVSVDAWDLIELNAWDWTGKTVDVWLNGTKVGDNMSIAFANGSFNNQLALDETILTANVDGYYDNVLVRNWRATEPAWGTWGAEQAN